MLNHSGSSTQTRLNNFVRGAINVQLTSCFTCLKLTIRVNMLFVACQSLFPCIMQHACQYVTDWTRECIRAFLALGYGNIFVSCSSGKIDLKLFIFLCLQTFVSNISHFQNETTHKHHFEMMNKFEQIFDVVVVSAVSQYNQLQQKEQQQQRRRRRQM